MKLPFGIMLSLSWTFESIQLCSENREYPKSFPLVQPRDVCRGYFSEKIDDLLFSELGKQEKLLF